MLCFLKTQICISRRENSGIYSEGKKHRNGVGDTSVKQNYGNVEAAGPF